MKKQRLAFNLHKTREKGLKYYQAVKVYYKAKKKNKDLLGTEQKKKGALMI